MGETITYFQDFKAVKPFYVSVEESLDRIRQGKIKDKIDHLRSITDPKEAKKYKTENLPCILFAGQFSARNDASLMSHSGYCILDFDHIDPAEYKKLLSPYQWVKAMFVSPSGDGLKVVAKIPEDSEKHRGYFRGIQKKLAYLPGFDSTSINLSRICFESYDPEIYINQRVVNFTDYEQETVIQSNPIPQKTASVSNWSLLDRAVKKIVDAGDGEKHAELLKASKLCGGWIGSGQLDEGDVVYALERAIQSRDIDDFAGAQKTIRDGINHGKLHPIVEEKVNLHDDDMSFVSLSDHEHNYLEAVRTNTLPQGLTTGYPEFDKHFRFKHGNLVIINGHDNVGKSSFLWYLAVLSNVLHGWKWILFCAENSEGQVRKTLMQFRSAKALHEMNQVEYRNVYQWAYDNFTIIKGEDLVNCEELLKMAQKINNKKQHQALLIDPYNALDLNLENTKLSSHEYHYKVTAMMRSFCKKNNITTFLNCHAVTEALRKVHKDGPYAGFLMAPNKADTEGGGKCSNRADDFITIHRHTQHPSDFNITEIHVRKIKETETGGRPTLKDDPIKFKMERGIYGFFDPATGFNPLSDEASKKLRENTIIQRLTFKEEDEDDVLKDHGDAPF